MFYHGLVTSSVYVRGGCTTLISVAISATTNTTNTIAHATSVTFRECCRPGEYLNHSTSVGSSTSTIALHTGHVLLSPNHFSIHASWNRCEHSRSFRRFRLVPFTANPAHFFNLRRQIAHLILLVGVFLNKLVVATTSRIRALLCNAVLNRLVVATTSRIRASLEGDNFDQHNY